MSKVQANTRKKLRRARMVVLREERAAAKAAKYEAIRNSRRPDRSLAVFAGCDPERTLALLKEDW